MELNVDLLMEGKSFYKKTNTKIITSKQNYVVLFLKIPIVLMVKGATFSMKLDQFVKFSI